MFDEEFLNFLNGEEIDNEYINNTNTKNRVIFNLDKSFEQLKNGLKYPSKNETIRLVSPAGGWSSCSLLMWICDKYIINDLVITSFAIGKKEMVKLTEQFENNKIKKATILLNTVMKESRQHQKTKRSEYIEEKTEGYDITIKYINNHSKVILCDCGKDKIVIETSSNFNENPKIEQFIISNSEEVYNYYIKVFTKLKLLEK